MHLLEEILLRKKNSSKINFELRYVSTVYHIRCTENPCGQLKNKHLSKGAAASGLFIRRSASIYDLKAGTEINKSGFIGASAPVKTHLFAPQVIGNKI